MKDFDIILASGSEHLKTSFQQNDFRVFTSALNYDRRRLFPNADIYAKLEDISELSDRRVVVIQACTGSGPAENEPYTTSDRVVELLLLLDLLSRPVAVQKVSHKKYECQCIPPPSHVEVVLTFQPFALQDKAFKTGEAVSARWAIETIAKACNKVWVVNPHAPDSLDWVQELRERKLYESIDVIPDLVKFAEKQFGFKKPVLVTPDEGAQERYQIDGFGKNRENSYKVDITGDLDVKDRQVIVVDDLTKSGSTLLKAADRLRNQGADDVGLAVAHVLPLIEKDEELLEELLEKARGMIVTTNTIHTETFCQKNPELTYNIVDTLVKVLR
ncbi:MAG: phosphoribosyltransferase family protein [Candidatus Thorarchaeota archaeon]